VAKAASSDWVAAGLIGAVVVVVGVAGAVVMKPSVVLVPRHATLPEAVRKAVVPAWGSARAAVLVMRVVLVAWGRA